MPRRRKVTKVHKVFLGPGAFVAVFWQRRRKVTKVHKVFLGPGAFVAVFWQRRHREPVRKAIPNAAREAGKGADTVPDTCFKRRVLKKIRP
ncbi:hypothetical protein [Desulfonema magnum]|uniref:hypothetical protein n=1 Tax=Desulfonema magnum TaxID=45655 RepID=UPI001A9BC74D|nr:hypothetical protein [Desulfonema magnum]